VHGLSNEQGRIQAMGRSHAFQVLQLRAHGLLGRIKRRASFTFPLRRQGPTLQRLLQSTWRPRL